jgi:glycosyltransferase involved in cell wall biosynthesis
MSINNDRDQVTDRSLRVLIVASEGPPVRGGIARFVQVLQDTLQARGHHVDVLSYPDIPRRTFGEIRISGLIFRLRALRKRLNEYDIIHLHGSAPTFSEIFLLFALSLRSRPPLVYTHHCDIDLPSFWFLDTLYNRLHHRLTATADEVVGVALDYVSDLYPDQNVSAIPLGIDSSLYDCGYPKDSQFTVLFVGQFRPYKGVPVLLKAMAKVHGGRLIIAGGGNEEQIYRELADRLGIEVEFHVNPDDDELRQLYQRAHVIVLPSVTRAEAFGVVLLEGMAAGCVPVSSSLPGIREVIGRTGFTFPVGSANGLAAILRRLRDDPRLVEQIAERARTRASAYTWERCVSRYERLFLDIVAARRLGEEPARPMDVVSKLEEFLSHVATHWNVERVAVLLQLPDGEWRRVAVPTADKNTLESAQEDALWMTAQRSHSISEPVLVRSDRVPQSPRGEESEERGSIIAAPIIDEQRSIGALIMNRSCPFDDDDLHDLVRLSGYIIRLLS